MRPSLPPPLIRSRALLLALALLAIGSVLLLRLAFTPHDGGAILRLELAPSGAAFAQSVRDDWLQRAAGPALGRDATASWCGVGLPHWVPQADDAPTAAVISKLRCNLLADSAGLVPGYVGLLLMFTLAAVPAGWSPALRRGCAALVLAAGGLDLAENGLTWRALDALELQPLLTAFLPDEVVASVRHASQAKWLLIALANALLGHLLFWHGSAAADTKLRRAAAGLLACAAGLLAAGALVWRPGIGAGMNLMMAALALLGWRAWKTAG